MKRYRILAGLALASILGATACSDAPTAATRTSIAELDPSRSVGAMATGELVALGAALFEDKNLSVNRNQSCQTCHEPSEGFAAPLPGTNTRGSVVEGSVPGQFGNRKPPTAAYATLAPRFVGGNNPTGGVFWDGRATGDLLGNPAADQALGPFLNPVEQALPDHACVIHRIVEQPARYAMLYPAAAWAAISSIVFPEHTAQVCATPVAIPGSIVSLSPADRAIADAAYHDVGRAIAAFEGTFNRFSSRFDRGELTAQERQGQQLFGGKGKCQQCHGNKGAEPLFTDFAFHNLGVPRNPDNPMGSSWTDRGLGGFTGAARHDGKFRTPTIRNVGRGQNRTFMHNGALVSLTQVVDFYSTRDVLPVCTNPEVLADPTRWGSTEFGGAGCWPPAEHPANIDTKNMGKLRLSPAEVAAIVAYMHSMSDD